MSLDNILSTFIILKYLDGYATLVSPSVCHACYTKRPKNVPLRLNEKSEKEQLKYISGNDDEAAADDAEYIHI